MSDIKLGGHGEAEGERGPRGRRGHDGHDGATGPTGPTGPGFTTPPLLAAARVNASGTFVAQKGFLSIAHVPASGVYTLTLANPPADTDFLAIEVTQVANGIPGVGGEATVGFPGPGPVIAVITFNSAGAPTDRAFMVTVFDLTP